MGTLSTSNATFDIVMQIILHHFIPFCPSCRFPSLESYMSVVIMGHLFFSFKSIWLLPIGLAVICVIGFSRVYSRSRFPHQIVGSWLFGLIGLLASMHCCEKMSFHTWGKHQHGTCVMVVLAAILCNFALSVEDNESRLFSVSKEEFLRVMSDLLSGTSSSSKGDGDQQQEQEGSSLVEVLDADALAAMSAAAADEGEFFDPTGQIPGSQRQLASYRSKTSSSGGRSSTTGRSSSEGAADTAAGTATSSSSSSSSSRMGESPRTLATKQAQINRLAAASNSDRLGSRKVRSDSLYFLQKSIEARENSYRLGTGITTGIAADQSDDDFQHLNAEAGFMRG
mmetsp:Transcript_28951/g.48611  ORF Transcript_28951/g.48611 Transcript_28951/m.48611 type:complete len:339 (+) Transcript_28951:377-1393(+)